MSRIMTSSASIISILYSSEDMHRESTSPNRRKSRREKSNSSEVTLDSQHAFIGGGTIGSR